MITELVPIEELGSHGLAKVFRLAAPHGTPTREPYEIINNGLIKRQLTKCVIN